MKGSNFKLVSAIVKGNWLINPIEAIGYLDLVDSLLAGNEVSFGSDEPIETKFAGNVAIISMSGPLMKDDFCGDAGMDSIAAEIKSLDSNSDIAGIILKVNSPGGSVQGTENLSKVVAETKKPIVALADQADSAAYWVISGANYIILSGETAEAGSIGTMASIRDMRVYHEKNGIKNHSISATKSTDKNKSYYDALNGNYEAIRAEHLDPLNEIFHSHIKAARNGISEKVFTGKVYLGSNAVSKGLADSIGTMEDAVAKVIELTGESGEGVGAEAALALAQVSAEEKRKIEIIANGKKNKNKEMFESKLEKAVEKVSAKVKADEEVLKEDVAPVNAALEAKGLKGYAIAKVEFVEALEAENETLIADKTALETKLKASETELTAQKAEVARLGGLAGAGHTEPIKVDGDKGANGSETKIVSQTDADLDKLLKEQKEN